MRVLEVIDKSFVGGGQVNVRNLLTGFLETEVEASLACAGGGPLVEQVRALGIAVHVIPFNKRFRPRPARALASIVRDERIELLHAHGLVATFYCTLARRFFGVRVPLVYHQHGFHHDNYGVATIGLRKQAERWVCSQADVVIPSSQEDRRQLIDGGYAPEERIRVLHNGIPEPVAQPPELADAGELFARLDESSGAPVVGIVARLHIQKGIDTFLRAAVRVREAVPDVRFVVVGSGEIEAECHALGEQLGLGESLIWTGTLGSIAAASRFDLAVISSRWEGLPIILLEYMALGKPIVTTAVAGCLEVVGEDEASIVPVDQSEPLAASMVELLNDPERAAGLGRAARKKFEQGFTLDVIARQTIDEFRRLLS